MVITIQQVFRPLFVLCLIVGLRFYPIKQSKSKYSWIGYLCALYFLTVWFAYSYVIYHVLTNNHPETDKVVFTGGICTTFTSAIFSLYHQKRFEILMKKLAAVDDTLEEFGTPKMYRKMYMQSKLMIIWWIIYIFTVNIYNVILQWYMSDTSWDIVIFNMTYYYHHINAIIDLLFVLFLRYIGSRFDKVSEHMQSLLQKMEHELRCTWKKSVIVHKYSLHINNYKRTIWTSMHLHLDLCRIARDLHMIFRMQLTTEVLFYLIHLPLMCFFLCLTVINKHRIRLFLQFRSLCWTFIFLIRLYSVNYVCANVTFKANNIDKTIHQLVDILRYNDVSKEIHQFTLQTMRYSSKFNGMDLFYFGNKFLQKFSMTMLTFIIIHAQFYTEM